MTNNINIEYNSSNEPTLKIKNEGSSFYLHSKYAPYKQAEKFAMEKFVYNKNIIVFGFGLGYHIVKLYDKMKDNQNLHIIECNIDILNIAKENNSDVYSIIDKPNIKLYASDNIDEIINIIKKLNALDDSVFIAYEPSVRAIPARLKYIRDILGKISVDKKSLNIFRDTMLNNHKRNESYEYENAGKILKYKFSKLPCIIVSAGPSLRNNIKKLKKAKGKALIFAVGRTVRYLEEEGIYPDLVIETDCQNIVASHFYDVDYMEAPLVLLSTATHSLQYAYDGEKWILYEKGIAKEDEKEYAVETGGSVATTAFSLARLMDCDPIIFMGQDLCFTGNKEHFDSKKTIQEKNNYIPVKGIDGKDYYTSKSLYNFLLWFEKEIDLDKTRKYYNCTEKGANIKSAINIDLDELLDEFTDKDIDKKVIELREKYKKREIIKVFSCTISINN